MERTTRIGDGVVVDHPRGGRHSSDVRLVVSHYSTRYAKFSLIFYRPQVGGRVSLSRGVSVQWGLFPGGSLSRWSLSKGICVEGGLCPGGSL